MSKYRVWILAFVVGMCVCSWAGNAEAWEFKMSGDFNYNFQTFAQSGRNGFFGIYDFAANDGVSAFGLGGFAPYNFWAGWHRRAGIVSGSDAEWQTYWMNSYIDIMVNPALKIRGLYRIGEWATSIASAATQPIATGDLGVGDLVASEYLEYRSSGIQRSFSPGYWNYLFMTAQLPWGIVNFGKRPSVFGTGLGWNGEDSRTSETFSISALYGPLNITLGVYPSRRGTTSGPGTGAANQASGYFNRDRDKNNTRLYDFGPTVAYRSGEIDMGVTMEWGPNYHTGGEGVIDSPGKRGQTVDAAGNRGSYVYLDNHAEFYGGAYFKFNNGRFFCNAEVDWDQTTEKTRGAKPSDRIGRGQIAAINIRDTSIEHWRYAVELGSYCGPAKFSGLFAWLSGGDRRGQAFGGGFLVGQIDRNGILRSSSFSNTGFFRPYSYLINEVYGTGVFQNPDTTNGYIEDAVVYGARLDYALAANLNFAASFMWADRASNSGFGWGCIKPDVSATPGNNIGQISNGNIFTLNNNQNTPNIPDSNLGYEIDGALDWKLLEGLRLKSTLAYWQPGKWFNWACVDRAINNWGTTRSAATPWTAGNTPAAAFIRPNRSIDAIWGFELKVVGEF